MKRAGSVSVAMDQALKAWEPGADLNVLAVAHGISPSGLYRALIRQGKLVKRERVPATDSRQNAD
jgi:hypothetical protein